MVTARRCRQTVVCRHQAEAKTNRPRLLAPPCRELASQNYDGKPCHIRYFRRRDLRLRPRLDRRPESRPPDRRAPPRRRLRRRHLRRPRQRRESQPPRARQRPAPPARWRHTEDHTAGPSRALRPTSRHSRRRAPRPGRGPTCHRAGHRHRHRGGPSHVRNALRPSRATARAHRC